MQITIFGLANETFKLLNKHFSVAWFDDVDFYKETGEIIAVLAYDTRLTLLNDGIRLMRGGDSFAVHRSEYNYIKME